MGAQTMRCRRFNLPVLLALVLTVCASLPAADALADWQYTRWGMSPRQVVAASRGTATLVPDEYKPENDRRIREEGLSPDLMEKVRLAASSIEIEHMVFQVALMFDARSHSLSEVIVGKDDCKPAEAHRMEFLFNMKYGHAFKRDFILYDEKYFEDIWRLPRDIIDFSYTPTLNSLTCLISYKPVPKEL